jgi:hypothetical protein
MFAISGLSKDTLATFAGQPGKLAEAAYEARKLGLDLEKLKGTQSALLDIESSIASEFEAEILTGKQLNLEKARYFALTNDYAGLAKELDKQDITRASFAKMNVIQQEATAKALGMSADTMGGMLMDQEAMSKLSSVDGDTAKEKFDNLVKEVVLLADKDYCLDIEKKLRPTDFIGWNATAGGGMPPRAKKGMGKGRSVSEETRKKLSEAGKGRKFSMESIEKIRQAALKQWFRQKNTPEAAE